jgi:hypothetical protein
MASTAYHLCTATMGVIVGVVPGSGRGMHRHGNWIKMFVVLVKLQQAQESATLKDVFTRFKTGPKM